MCGYSEDGVKTVLIVDDEPEFRNYIKRVAEICGWQSKECATGAGIVPVLEDGPAITLIVLDINMPDVDGIEAVLELAKKQPRAIPICVVTGGSEVYLGVVEELAKFNGFEIAATLRKPFAIEELKQVFARY